MLDLLILVYAQIMTMLTEFQKVLSQELTYLCSETVTALTEQKYLKLWM